jgi:hypothetical protein
LVANLRRWIVRRILAFLTKPLPRGERRVWNDPRALARHIRKGDVLLVEGDNRISVVIQYLTQSCWSHAALYIGDELVRRGGPRADAARAAFGEHANALLVEALPDGVVASPLTKYLDHNIRIARPHRLRPDHLKTILDDAVAAIGWRYDLRNVLDLARYLLPVRVVPHRFRRVALHLGSGRPTEVICSSLLGQLFAKVRFPILPRVEHPEEETRSGPAWLRRIVGDESTALTGLFRMRHPTLLTPRDFDLSPYFEIVKFNVIAGGGFDYQRIQWAEGDDEEALVDATEPLRGAR